MGLQGQVSDCSSESILIIAVVTIASCVNYIRSLTLSLLNLSRVDPVHDEILGPVGSGLASLVLLAEQLNLNRVCSSRFNGEPGSKCIVCLSGLKEGEHVRRLTCCHEFHKECLDGWLQGINFSCPLCRAPVVEERRVDCTRRRVGSDLVKFFSLR